MWKVKGSHAPLSSEWLNPHLDLLLMILSRNRCKATQSGSSRTCHPSSFECKCECKHISCSIWLISLIVDQPCAMIVKIIKSRFDNPFRRWCKPAREISCSRTGRNPVLALSRCHIALQANFALTISYRYCCADIVMFGSLQLACHSSSPLKKHDMNTQTSPGLETSCNMLVLISSEHIPTPRIFNELVILIGHHS